MAMTHSRGLALFDAAHLALGAHEAEPLMGIGVSVGADIASNADVARLRVRFATVRLTTSLAQTALTVRLIVALQR